MRDSLARRDSARVPATLKDSVKAPIAYAEAPVIADPTGSFVWDRRDLFSTGALTVQDLLDRVPGITGIRGSWIAQPMVSSFLGDPGRIRVFLDGLELIELDPRMNRVWDLTQIPIWALDDLRIERGAGEVRIHMRTWRVDRTTPYTRTDIYTGDQATNLYRGLFGRRYSRGEILQAAGQQFGTDPGRGVSSSDQLGILVRTGIARERWSADVLFLRGDRNRGLALPNVQTDSIPATESTRTDAYLRLGWGRPHEGAWAQAIALASKYAFGGQPITGSTEPTADTSRVESQYLLTGGYSWRGFQISVAQRYRAGLQRRIATPSARLGFESPLLTVSALVEGRGTDSTRRAEVSGVVRPIRFLFFSGAAGVERRRPLPDSLVPPNDPGDPTFVRAEGGVRVGDVSLSAGLVRRDPVTLDPLTIFRSGTAQVTDASLTGQYAIVRGRIWKSLYADVQGMRWDDTGGVYRPKYVARSELFISTGLRDRFPSGNFHLLASATHEYRSSSLWPDAGTLIRVAGYRTISTLLQVRILQAELFWNFRNILGERYEHVPGYALPRLSNMYGVRWEFWN